MMQMVETYFNNLAAAASSDKAVMEELVKTNATLMGANAMLTGSNSKLATTVKCLTLQHEELQRTVNSLSKKLGLKAGDGNQPSRVPKKFLNCKKKVLHCPDNCFKLEKNAARHPLGWQSCL